MKDIECPACGKMIPDDSKFCDQCGVELLECINCGALGTDPYCAECGRPMVARKGDKAVKIEDEEIDKKKDDEDDGNKTIGGRRKKTVLKSRIEGVTLVPEDEGIIGRGEGPYSRNLSGFDLISRRHGKFVRRGRDWYIVDFGSTNGTYVNDEEVPTDTPVKIKVGDVVDIGTFIFDVKEI